MNAAVEATKQGWTEEELQTLPDNGYSYELVNGALVMSPKNTFEHENLCARLLFALTGFNRAHHLGAVLDGERVLPGFQFPIAGLFEQGEWE